MGTTPIHRCQFPGCEREVKKGRLMCSGHSRKIAMERANKRSRGKSIHQIIEIIKQRKKIEQRKK